MNWNYLNFVSVAVNYHYVNKQFKTGRNHFRKMCIITIMIKNLCLACYNLKCLLCLCCVVVVCEIFHINTLIGSVMWCLCVISCIYATIRKEMFIIRAVKFNSSSLLKIVLDLHLDYFFKSICIIFSSINILLIYYRRQ